ncbi:MAG: NAD(P)/FAD-dependent oxidoreductase [Campylobacterales bacterium]|nr:NAD(P)/FAD-dependent oxidoreductase [Campylobacterales bacterium]
MNQSRRDLLKASGIGAAALALGGVAATSASAAENPAAATELLPKPTGKRVVIVGGGWGGLTAARYIKKEAPEAEVVVLEKRDVFVSCPISNEWLAGEIPLDFLTRDYFTAAKNYGYKMIQTTVTGIDRASRTVSTTTGSIGYDYLLLSPGIAYDYTKWFGNDTLAAERCRQECPPALMSGSEHVALKKMLEDFEGGNFVISVPDGPYRCPPAPYERAAMVAHYFKKNGIEGKVIILDPKGKPAPKGPGFLAAYKELYPDIVEYRPSSLVKTVDLDKKEVVVTVTHPDDRTEEVRIPYAAANLMPVNKASEIVAMAGVSTGKAGWGMMNSPTFQSKADERVFVIGDAVGGYPYPKSGAIANSQGRIVATHIAGLIQGRPALANMTLPDNICYSMVNGEEAISIGVTFSLMDDKDVNGNDIKVIKPKMTENNTRSTALGKTTHEWYKGMMRDIFGS